MSGAFEAHYETISSFQLKLEYVKGATGVAIAAGQKVVTLDVFDKTATCEADWDRLLSGVVLEALEVTDRAGRPTASVVEKLIRDINAQPCEPAPAIGEGDDFRSVSKLGDHASALAFEKTVVHGSVIAGE